MMHPSNPSIYLRRSSNSYKNSIVFTPAGSLSPTNVNYEVGTIGSSSDFFNKVLGWFYSISKVNFS